MLVARLAIDDRAGTFRALAETELDRSYRLASVLLGDVSEGEDATHDAFLRAWHGWSSLRDRSSFGPWFSQILVNVCRDRLRRRGRSVTVSELPDRPVESAGWDPEREVLLQALGRLNADQRTVVVLRFYADRPLEEIARLTGARLGTVKSRLHHGLRALRAAYDAIERREDDR